MQHHLHNSSYTVGTSGLHTLTSVTHFFLRFFMRLRQPVNPVFCSFSLPSYCFPNSPEIINYDGFFVSLKELDDSMKPTKWLSNNVVEAALIKIRETLPKDSKKVIMPLRVAVSWMRTVVLVSHNIPLSLPFLQCVSWDSFSSNANTLAARNIQRCWDTF